MWMGHNSTPNNDLWRHSQECNMDGLLIASMTGAGMGGRVSAKPTFLLGDLLLHQGQPSAVILVPHESAPFTMVIVPEWVRDSAEVLRFS